MLDRRGFCSLMVLSVGAARSMGEPIRSLQMASRYTLTGIVPDRPVIAEWRKEFASHIDGRWQLTRSKTVRLFRDRLGRLRQEITLPLEPFPITVTMIVDLQSGRMIVLDTL